MHDSSDDSDDRWRAALAPLGEAGVASLPGLEERIGRSLLARRARTRRARWMRLALAAMLLLILGGAGDRWWLHRSTPGSTEPRFLLLLFEGPGYDSVSAGHQERVAEYRNWAQDLARRGHLVDAAELDPAEDRLGTMPAASGGGHLIAGMFIVRARDEREAMAIAATCPHLRHGGGISLRPLRSS